MSEYVIKRYDGTERNGLIKNFNKNPESSSFKISIDDEIINKIDKTDIGWGVPIPVWFGEHISDIVEKNKGDSLYIPILNRLLKKNIRQAIRYTELSNVGTILVTEWSSISDKEIDLFRQNGVNIGYDLLNQDYYRIRSVKDRMYSGEIIEPVKTCKNIDGYLNEVDVTNAIIEVNDLLSSLASEGVNVYVFRLPDYEELDYHTYDEEYRHNNGITGYSEINSETEEQLRKVFGSQLEIKAHGHIVLMSQRFNGKYIVLNDTHGNYMNVTNGFRKTTDIPSITNRGGAQRHAFAFGPCTIGGDYTEDKYTIPSIMQRSLNRDGHNVVMHNCGTLGGLRAYAEQIKANDIYSGDYVILFDHFSKKLYEAIDSSVNKIDLLGLYNKRPEDIFIEVPAHMSAKGNEYIAEGIYRYIDWSEDIDEHVIVQKKQRDFILTDEMKQFAQHLSGNKAFGGERIGSIVMNCNPFTLGHAYLIQKALEDCDYLYIFVVEEDSSEFKFKDRYEMVQKAVERNERVKVMPSGRLILSNVTLPEYFKKEYLQGVEVNPTLDVEIYANVVCPALGIKVRYVGEEPFDTVTRQYNESMKEILPMYGVDVVEVPRYKNNGKVISATEVRRFLQEGDYEEIRNCVPYTTFQIIMDLKHRR